MFELFKALLLDLANPFTRHAEVSGDFFEGSRQAVDKAESEHDDFFFALGKGVED